EYHPTLIRADRWDCPTHLVLDIDPPSAEAFPLAARAAQLVRQALTDTGLVGAVKTSGAKGLHVFVPIEGQSTVDAAAATRAIALRAERLDSALATTAFIREDRAGKVFIDSTRAGGATVVSAYSPRVRPKVPVSFPVAWDELDRVTPGDFTLHTAASLIADADLWADQMPGSQQLSSDLIEEGHANPVARVQAMHEGKRRDLDAFGIGSPVELGGHPQAGSGGGGRDQVDDDLVAGQWPTSPVHRDGREHPMLNFVPL